MNYLKEQLIKKLGDGFLKKPFPDYLPYRGTASTRLGLPVLFPRDLEKMRDRVIWKPFYKKKSFYVWVALLLLYVFFTFYFLLFYNESNKI